MTRYQLAKLVDWASTLQGRKRMQKVVFMLQAAGCPHNADFFLHHYGPYSEHVARLADEMTRMQLLTESARPAPNGLQYSYDLPNQIRQELCALEATPQGQEWAGQLAPFEEKAKQFLQADLRQLEYASTIVYFRRLGHDWAQAVEMAVSFKNDWQVRNALALAQQAIA